MVVGIVGFLSCRNESASCLVGMLFYLHMGGTLSAAFGFAVSIAAFSCVTSSFVLEHSFLLLSTFGNIESRALLSAESLQPHCVSFMPGTA